MNKTCGFYEEDNQMEEPSRWLQTTVTKFHESFHEVSWKFSRSFMKVFTKHYESFHKASWKFSQSIGKVFTMERDCLREKAARTVPSLLLRRVFGFFLSHCHGFSYLFVYHLVKMWQKVWQMWQTVTIKNIFFVTRNLLVSSIMTRLWQLWQKISKNLFLVSINANPM